MPMRKKRPNSRSQKALLRLFLAGVLAIVLFVALRPDRMLLSALKTRAAPTTPASTARIMASLEALDVDRRWIAAQGTQIRVRLPASLHPLIVYQRLAQDVGKHGGQIVSGKAGHHGEMQLHLELPGAGRRIIELIPDSSLVFEQAEIALIIDDFGYNRTPLIQEFLDLPFPYTGAVIPGLLHSKTLAEELAARGRPVLVHVPMEPEHGRVEMGEFTLLTSLSEGEIHARMRQALEAIPHARGVNNHMGSKATTDSVLLRAALTEIREKGFFFVDSRTSRESIAYNMARELGVPALRNNIFLDPIDTPEHIEGKLQALAAIARSSGRAIGIGHPRPNTLAALQKIVPELQARGYRFVFVDAFLDRSLSLKD